MLVEAKSIEGDVMYLCEECGFGYAERETAEECERWCSTRRSCNIEITRNAIYIPPR